MNTRRIVQLAAFGLFATVIIAGAASAAPLPDNAAIPKDGHNVYLQSVSAVSPSDVWTVGYRDPLCCSGGEAAPLVKHWDGVHWRTIASFDGAGQLWSVAAVSSDDVWAVGNWQPTGDGYHEVLVLHWDGTRWSKIATPTYPASSFLTRVSFTSSTNVVARGYWYSGGESASPVCLIWRGSSWRNCPLAVAPVVSMDALSPTDAWRVGYVEPDGTHEHTYAAHWNGESWKKTPTPDQGVLTSVIAIGADDVWAAGSQPLNPQGLFEHWDGTRWTAVDDPHSDEFDEITGLGATASNDVWASGHSDGGGHGRHGVLQHWDGHAWSDSENPCTKRLFSDITGVVALSATDAWAVGFYDGGSIPEVYHRILMHWDGTQWSNIAHHWPC